MVTEDMVLAMPNLAPLTPTMILHILQCRKEDVIDALGKGVHQGKNYLLQKYQNLEQQTILLRSSVYNLLLNQKIQEDGTVPIKEIQAPLRQIMQEKALSHPEAIGKLPVISVQMLYPLAKNHVLKEKRKGQIDVDSEAAVLFAALLDHRLKHFVPQQETHETWWCYSQSPPTQSGKQAPIIPRPFPLPAGLEPGTLVWSHWPSFNPWWLRFPYGSMQLVNPNAETLLRWNPALATQDVRRLLTDNAFKNFRQQTIQDLARSTLYSLSVSRLASMQMSIPTFDIYWNRNITK